MSAICPSTTALILGAIIFWCLYWLTVFIYRVYLSPLSHIPGPKLAAATFWYEFYYEIYPNQFQYLWKIQALNNQYGPIVRINPLHVHIHDHDYYTTIYASGHRKRNRCSWYMHSGAKAMNGIVDVIDHDFHKRKRQAMEPFFSKRSVQGLESQIVDKVEKLLSRLSSALSECEDNDTSEKGTIVNLSDAMCALALDIVSEYAFGEPYGALDRDDYARDFVRILREGMQMRVLGRQFPWLVNTLLDLPSWIAIRINKNMADISMWFEDMTRMIDAVRAEKTDATSTKSHSNLKRTVFHEYLDKELPEDEKATSALLGTGANLIGAGTETTARNLAVTIYYLLQNKDMLEQLRRELKIAIPVRNSRASLADLEKLPYLVSESDLKAPWS
jgi:cytochrome P450